MHEAADYDTAQLAQELARAGARVEPLLAEIYPQGEEDFLTEPFWYHMGTGGKRIRPALCLLTCEALGGEGERALPFAAAVELLHNMLLVHDDIEDGDTVRRDTPTVWVAYGVANAINLGDDMLARAYSLVLRSPVEPPTRLRLSEAFCEALECTCRGQALDLNSRGRADFTLDDYLRMVTLKTGRYLALGMVGGAIAARAEEPAVERIKGLGDSMGPAFQIRDDVIDLTQGKGRGGLMGNDIREGKPSILYAHALEATSGGERDRLVEIVSRERASTTDEEVAWVTGLYQQCGSLDFARRKADEMIEEAFKTIEGVPVQNRDFFRSVIRFMAQRTT